MLKLTSLLFLATSTQALWLAIQEVEQNANIGGTIRNVPFCQVGKGDTADQASRQASQMTTRGIALGGVRTCKELPYSKGNQLGGFWNDHGTINYIDSNWHWYCNPGNGKAGRCDAGRGAPRR